ncbi:MAG: hypothetical protein GY913_24530 [Proteobacteria bacterium]|nr:hypothetical protein [Pseudomonadota bacterium]MCP4920081.1 hypothetical protein [Pseudomonadota bacterium]
MTLLLLLSCTKDNPDSGLTEPWGVAGTDLGDAMLLSGWSDGELLRMVGGELGGGHGDLLTWNGTDLCVEHNVSDTTLWWIDGTPGGSYWMVGEQGTVVHSSGERRDVPTEMTLYGIDVEDENVWTVGGDPASGTGGIWRWNGTDWDEQLTSTVMFKVDQHADGTALFVGDGATWIYEDGYLTELPHEQRLVTVHEGMAVGGTASATVVEWSGSSWTESDALYLNGPLNGLYVGDKTWVAGNAGVMGYRGDDRWMIPDLPLTADTFHAVVEHDGMGWFLGGNFFNAGNNHGTIGIYGDLTIPDVSDCG